MIVSGRINIQIKHLHNWIHKADLAFKLGRRVRQANGWHSGQAWPIWNGKFLIKVLPGPKVALCFPCTLNCNIYFLLFLLGCSLWIGGQIHRARSGVYRLLREAFAERNPCQWEQLSQIRDCKLCDTARLSRNCLIITRSPLKGHSESGVLVRHL